jgi:hypothetical protein
MTESFLIDRVFTREQKVVYRLMVRVLTILELLQAHGRMTGAELARRLEVVVNGTNTEQISPSHVSTCQEL